MYEPALIKFENTSAGFGFSLNLVILFSSSIPTIPKRVGSSTSQSPKLPIPPFELCSDNNFPTSREEIISPLKQANVPLTTSRQLPSAPPVPSGSVSLTILTSKSQSIESESKT